MHFLLNAMMFLNSCLLLYLTLSLQCPSLNIKGSLTSCRLCKCVEWINDALAPLFWESLSERPNGLVHPTLVYQIYNREQENIHKFVAVCVTMQLDRIEILRCMLIIQKHNASVSIADWSLIILDTVCKHFKQAKYGWCSLHVKNVNHVWCYGW